MDHDQPQQHTRFLSLRLREIPDAAPKFFLAVSRLKVAKVRVGVLINTIIKSNEKHVPIISVAEAIFQWGFEVWE